MLIITFQVLQMDILESLEPFIFRCDIHVEGSALPVYLHNVRLFLLSML